MTVNDLLEIPPWEWPDDAAELIQKCLADRHADPSERLVAAELAGEIVAMDDDLVGAILAIAGRADELEDLRASAILALGPVLEVADGEFMDEDLDDPEDVPISLDTFRHIQDSLQSLYLDPTNSGELRRRILETAVRAPQDWQANEIKMAYSSGVKDWVVTAVFAMRWVRGFDECILEAMDSADPDIHCEAVKAAGGQELDAAWPHVAELLRNPATPKPLLLGAIEAAVNIHPQEAAALLDPLAESRDEEISEAVSDALSMIDAMTAAPDENHNGGDWVN